MDVEKFIEEVRKFPVLYDQGDEKYRNTEYKERVWRTIANTLEIKGGVEDCKKKWASIRDQLRRTLQKRKTKSGQATEKSRKYKYEDILTFLLPYLGEREGLTNVPQVGDEDDDFEFAADSQDISTQETYQEENVGNVDEQHTEVEKNLTVNNKHTSMRSRESSSPIPSKVSAKKDKFATPSAIKRKIPGREVKPEASPASQLMAYILAEKEVETLKGPNSQTCKQDPVDAFLCGIAPTLKSLDAILLNGAKGKIFGIVQEVELKQLQSNAGSQERYFMSNYSTSPSPSSAESSSSSVPQHMTISNYSTLSSQSRVQSVSPLTPSHITTPDETTNLNGLSYYQF